MRTPFVQGYELIYIDISRDDKYDLGRDDLSVESNSDIIKIINDSVISDVFIVL